MTSTVKHAGENRARHTAPHLLELPFGGQKVRKEVKYRNGEGSDGRDGGMTSMRRVREGACEKVAFELTLSFSN